MPETNSSSSHAISINMGPDLVMPGDPRFNLEIKDNILIVPVYKSSERYGGSTFGQASDKYCDPRTKLQYICGYYCSGLDAQGQKKITKLKRYLKRVLGVKDVIFEWDIDYFRRVSEFKKENPGYIEDLEDEVWRNNPEVDHESTDLFEEINESFESFKNFVFNAKTWLYLSGDGVSGYYSDSWIKDDEEEVPDYILSIHFDPWKNQFGDRIDFSLWSIRDFIHLNSYFRLDFSIRDAYILEHTVFDIPRQEFRMATLEEYERVEYPYQVTKPDKKGSEWVRRKEKVKSEILKHLSNYFSVDPETSTLRFCFIGEKLRELYLEARDMKKEENRKKWESNIESAKMVDEIIKTHPELKEGTDYVRVSASLESTKFGRII